jgi:hypothetical protein
VDLVLAGDAAYWIENPGAVAGGDSHPYELHKAPKGGGASTVLAKCVYGPDSGSLDNPAGALLVKDGDALYLPCPPDLASAAAVAVDRHAQEPRRIAVDATHLYWTQKQAIGRAPLP